jgi:FtsP/CotA-like multicopper oxidase with cupredoxin domain
VKSAADQKKYTIVVRTRYERYIGDFVLHCHILDHEDQGMMQMVRVALPDGAGGIATGHSH